jgi:hypothetical protein
LSGNYGLASHLSTLSRNAINNSFYVLLPTCPRETCIHRCNRRCPLQSALDWLSSESHLHLVLWLPLSVPTAAAVDLYFTAICISNKFIKSNRLNNKLEICV